jgi:hypothetical protein
MNMRSVFFALIPALALLSCKKDKPEDGTVDPPAETSAVRIQPKFASEDLQLDHTYALNDSTDVQIVEMKFYLSNITAGGVQKKDYSLFDYRQRGTTLYSFATAPGSFGSFAALVGVPQDVNHSDPAAFPSSSMLNSLNANDMYWGWSGGFIFLKIEAKADTIPDGVANFDHNLVYHVAADGFTGNINFPSVSWSQSGNAHFLDFKVDVEQIFNNPAGRIEVRNEFQTPHMPAPEGSLTEKVMNNFISAFSVL